MSTIDKGPDPRNASQRAPVVFVKNGAVFANSRDVAAYFEKEHKHVLRDIDKLMESPAVQNRTTLFSAVSEFSPEANRTVRYFEMSRAGFVLLTMGYTGESALNFKLNYIERFDQMEERLKRNEADLDNPTTLRGLLAKYAERAEVAEDALERIAETEGEYTRKASAQILQVPSEKFLTEWLEENRWIYRERGQTGYVLYQDKRDASVAVLKFEKIPTGKLVPVIYLTTRGLTEIAKALYRDEPAKLFPLLAVIQGQRALVGRA